MEYRELGRTGWKISTISFGAWAIGGTWGDVKDEESLAALHRALDLGVNFFDTADVYGDGRRSDPHVAQSYTRENLTAYVERSLKNLEVDVIDLLQLHSPPMGV